MTVSSVVSHVPVTLRIGDSERQLGFVQVLADTVAEEDVLGIKMRLDYAGLVTVLRVAADAVEAFAH